MVLAPVEKEKTLSDEQRKELMLRVSEVRIKTLNVCPFFGHLLLKMEPVITASIPLAAVTRDRRMLLNPEWLAKTSSGELAATMVHETLHIALGVWERQGNRNLIVWSGGGPSSLWNIAHDFAINLLIADMANDVPYFVSPEKWEPAGLLDRKYENWSAEEIYDDLAAKAKPMPNPPPGGGGSGPGPGQPKKNKGNDKGEGEGEGEGKGQGDGDDDGTGQGNGPGKLHIPNMPDARPDLADEGKSLSDSEAKEIENYWKVALVEAAMVHQNSGKGKLPGRLQMIIDSILEPKIHWRDVLSRWVGENGRRSDYHYARPSRRSESVGELLPSLKKHSVSDVCVLWDTSGSMHGREVEILSECVGICEDLALSLRVICCDTQIHSDQFPVDRAEDVDVKGGGGSNFCPAFSKLEEENFDGVVIAFTDGVIDVPVSMPVHIRGLLWVIWEGDVDPTQGRYGEVLYIKNDVVKR